MRAYGVSLAAAMMVLTLGPATNASHLVPISSSCTYELGLTGDALVVSYPFPGSEPVTGDGHVNIGGCVWEFPDTSSPGFPGENFEGLGNPSCADIGAGVIPTGMACISYGILVGGQYSLLQASIIDAVFGSDIGGRVCSDHDGDFRCGDDSKGEISKAFCHVSPVLDATNATGVAIFVDGPLSQGFLQQTLPDDVGGEPGPFGSGGDCSSTNNPVGGTRGTITITFSG